MRGVNKAIIIGTLGKDPEVKHLPNGNAVANISVATSEQWLDKSGAKQEATEWHKVVIYGKLAEIAGEYLKKGSKAYFSGKIKTRKWQDQSGQDRYTTEIQADEMQMLGSNDNKYEKDGIQNSNYSPPKHENAVPQQRAEPASFDDDIPF